MFFKLAMRNSRRSRKENGLFFASLVVSIVAFYIILALSHQDVMIFLKSLESDAVNSLLQIAAVFYVFSLIMLFFLIYYASKYQLERRRHELGMYIMMGMRRSKLFALLMAEDLGSSVLALIIGLPIAVLVSEVVSLLTARLVGLGVIGHHVSFSLGHTFNATLPAGRSRRRKRATCSTGFAPLQTRNGISTMPSTARTPPSISAVATAMVRRCSIR